LSMTNTFLMRGVKARNDLSLISWT
jgi:hypothetical protein